jgi:hypothetical protein
LEALTTSASRVISRPSDRVLLYGALDEEVADQTVIVR